MFYKKGENLQIYKQQFPLSNDQSGSIEILNKIHIWNMNYWNCKQWKGLKKCKKRY